MQRRTLSRKRVDLQPSDVLGNAERLKSHD